MRTRLVYRTPSDGSLISSLRYLSLEHGELRQLDAAQQARGDPETEAVGSQLGAQQRALPPGEAYTHGLFVRLAAVLQSKPGARLSCNLGMLVMQSCA